MIVDQSRIIIVSDHGPPEPARRVDTNCRRNRDIAAKEHYQETGQPEDTIAEKLSQNGGTTQRLLHITPLMIPPDDADATTKISFPPKLPNSMPHSLIGKQNYTTTNAILNIRLPENHRTT